MSKIILNHGIKITIGLLLFCLFSCIEMIESKVQRADSDVPMHYSIGIENLDTTLEMIYFPESLIISKDSLNIQVREYYGKYDFNIIDTVFLLRKMLKNDIKIGSARTIYFPFDNDSSNFEFFTSPLDTTEIDLNKYSFFPDAAIFHNEPRRYRGGPCYFRIIEKNGDKFEFDGETINSIGFMSKISPSEYLLIFNIGVKYQKGYSFSIGILNTANVRTNHSHGRHIN